MKPRTETRLILMGMFVFPIIWVAAMGLIIYVAVHYITKFW